MIYSLTHAVDLDGMASAALLVRNYGMPISNIMFVDYSGKEFDRAMDSVNRIDGSGNVLVITDFSMTGGNAKSMGGVLSGFRKRGNRIIWLDHHPWDRSMIAKASRYCDIMIVGENPLFCAAELVYRLLCTKDSYSDELARITHLADFWFKSKSKRDNDLVNKIAFGIKHIRSYADSEDRLRSFVLELSRGNLHSKAVGDAYKEYISSTRPELKKMLGSCSVMDVNGVRIGVGFGRVLSAQEACMAIIEKLKCDIGIYISTDHMHGSMRSLRDSKTWGVDILKLAESLSGGGHPLAAGFTIEHDGYDVSKVSDRRAVVERIRKTAGMLYKKKVLYFQQSTGKRAMR